MAQADPSEEARGGSGQHRRQRSFAKGRLTVPRHALNDSQATRGAGAAGVGGGTVLAILASALPDSILKTVLIWLAPAATLTLSALWIWARRKIIVYFEEQEAEKYFQAARKALEEALQNSSLTPEQRAEFERNRLELDQLIVQQKLAKAAYHARRK